MGDGSQPTTVETAPQAAENKPPPASPASPMGRTTLVVLVLGVGLYGYHLLADRLTPYTDQATVQAYVVNLAPDVSGRVKAVNVVDNQRVRAGQILFAIDPERYEIAIKSAEAQLASAGEAVGASAAALASAEARLATSEANLINVQKQTARVFELVERGFRPKADGDESRASLRSANADVVRAKADVEQARQNLGPLDGNAQVRSAQAALYKARRDLSDVVIRAPSNGDVTNLQLATGRYVGAGQTALTFVDADVIWIESQFRENSLEHIKPGNSVGISLDARPGRVYPGKVESIGWGVDNRDVDPATGLPVIKNDSGWVRDPQRFAVRVRLDANSQFREVRVGSQASLVVYTGKSAFTDAIGRLWIGLVSYLSYLN
jgi:multidrug resistance efflux pump